MGAQNFNFAPKFSKSIFSAKFCTFDTKDFGQENVSQLVDSPK